MPLFPSTFRQSLPPLRGGNGQKGNGGLRPGPPAAYLFATKVEGKGIVADRARTVTEEILKAKGLTP